MAALPNVLSVSRLLLVPVLLLLAWFGLGKFFLPLLVFSLITDALDGFLARKFNLASKLGAMLDSWADLLTGLALPFCGWWLRPDVVRDEAVFLGAGMAIYFGAILAGFLKFGRLASYHTWAAKSAAIALGAAVLVIFSGGPGWPLRVAMPLVMLACAEEIVMTALLKEWHANVPTLWHALKLRKFAK